MYEAHFADPHRVINSFWGHEFREVARGKEEKRKTGCSFHRAQSPAKCDEMTTFRSQPFYRILLPCRRFLSVGYEFVLQRGLHTFLTGIFPVTYPL